jgi:hypothetical protein
MKNIDTNLLDQIITGTYEIVDGVVNVEGDVNILKEMTEIPFKFGIVSGSFFCNNTKITSCEGGPE